MNKDSVIIHLKAGVQDPLDFQKEHLACQEAIKKGLSLKFVIDLGLFSKLKRPLSNKSQYLSLELSLEHFKNTLWSEFHESIVDICLYEGDLDFSDFIIFQELTPNLQEWILERFSTIESFRDESGIQITNFEEITPELLVTTTSGKFIKSLFCRDVAFDYLQMLKANLPDAMPLSIKLEEKGDLSPLKVALLTHREVYEPFILSSEINHKPKIAVCLPSSRKVILSHYAALNDALNYLREKHEPYRLIPESMLISEWDLVDYLLVLPHLLDSQGKRKLQGFVAAGGTVVTLGDALGLDNEISFATFCDLSKLERPRISDPS